MAKSNRHAGQFNLRGKKTLRLRCKCCEVQDFRNKLETARVRKELYDKTNHASDTGI